MMFYPFIFAQLFSLDLNFFCLFNALLDSHEL